MEHEYKCNALVVHIYLAVKMLWDELMQRAVMPWQILVLVLMRTASVDEDSNCI